MHEKYVPQSLSSKHVMKFSLAAFYIAQNKALCGDPTPFRLPVFDPQTATKQSVESS